MSYVVVFLTNSTLLTTEHDEKFIFYVHTKQLLYYLYQYKMVCKHETSSLKIKFLNEKAFQWHRVIEMWMITRKGNYKFNFKLQSSWLKKKTTPKNTEKRHSLSFMSVDFHFPLSLKNY